MAISTEAFVAGVGVLVSLDVLSLGALMHLARNVGEDDLARKRGEKAKQLGREAEEQAQAAHHRLTRHLNDAHDEDVTAAVEAERQARPDGGTDGR